MLLADQLHPLQAPTDQQAALFDSDYLNLDLSLSSSAASSVINGGRYIRPWGSQDTLVQTDKKRPIYAQFIENEKNAMISTGLSNHDYPDTYSRPLSLSDYYDDKQDTTITMSDDMSTKHDEEEGYEYCDDTKEGYEKYDPKYEKYHHSEPYPGEKYMDDEKNPKRKFEHQDSLRNDYTNQGFWLGCCFISCGHRHEKKQDGKQGRQNRKEKDTELDARPKNRGCGRRGWVFCTFITLILSILITYFIWPRTPLMRIEGASLTTPAKITQTRQGVMVGNVAFESQWLVNVTVDNRQNHVPTRIVQVQLLAKDALTGLVIGKGLHNDDPNQEHIVLAANSISTIQLPVYVDYQARDATDTTFVDLTKACAPENSVVYNSPDGGVAKNQHEALPLHFWITLHFFGLDWLGYKPTVIATPATGGFACPQS
jgi:ribosomal protein S8E